MGCGRKEKEIRGDETKLIEKEDRDRECSYLKNTQNFIATKEGDVLIEFELNLGKYRLFVPHRLSLEKNSEKEITTNGK